VNALNDNAPRRQIPAVAAEIEADAALAARAQKLGLGLAKRLATPETVESINADLLSALEDILALPGTALGRCSLREAEVVARANAAIARARALS